MKFKFLILTFLSIFSVINASSDEGEKTTTKTKSSQKSQRLLDELRELTKEEIKQPSRSITTFKKTIKNPKTGRKSNLAQIRFFANLYDDILSPDASREKTNRILEGLKTIYKHGTVNASLTGGAEDFTRANLLHAAAHHNDELIVEALLSIGAKESLENYDETFHIAAHYPAMEILREGSSTSAIDIIKQLIQAKANFKKKNRDDDTPLGLLLLAHRIHQAKKGASQGACQDIKDLIDQISPLTAGRVKMPVKKPSSMFAGIRRSAGSAVIRLHEWIHQQDGGSVEFPHTVKEVDGEFAIIEESSSSEETSGKILPLSSLDSLHEDGELVESPSNLSLRDLEMPQEEEGVE